ncbi:hypothetical protein ml_203 [Mollivirus sibericum]|uniref:hypothetical protein n=1 Tax=Mollivirus sibericum TaxID=1678078 RepID=UPI0006B2D8EA|nr:hypothetical protein ml_203 [Mollivirus sibericum]ALD62005.1 hypothetical protein ml_203 [Mollivirus sibericum]
MGNCVRSMFSPQCMYDFETRCLEYGIAHPYVYCHAQCMHLPTDNCIQQAAKLQETLQDQLRAHIERGRPE